MHDRPKYKSGIANDAFADRCTLPQLQVDLLLAGAAPPCLVPFALVPNASHSISMTIRSLVKIHGLS